MIPILVIDHDKARLFDTAGILLTHGYCPVTARFDSEALFLLDQIPVELALVECPRSDPDRSALVHAIRRHHPDVAVVAVIDRDSAADDHPSLHRMGVAGTLQRPFQPLTLINLVGHHALAAQAA
jgi:DNA-binding NtrC family response regulator